MGQILGESLYCLAFLGRDIPLGFLFCLEKGLLQVIYSFQFLVPPPLQLRRHQTIVGVDGIVLALR
jgi:hypothetical protein